MVIIETPKDLFSAGLCSKYFMPLNAMDVNNLRPFFYLILQKCTGRGHTAPAKNQSPTLGPPCMLGNPVNISIQHCQLLKGQTLPVWGIWDIPGS